MSSIDGILKLSTEYTDSHVIGKDGRISVHSVLMGVHSEFMRDILKTVPDISESTFILPDFSLKEIAAFGRLIYGLSKSEYLSDIFLKTLGIFQLDKIRCAYLDGIIMVDGGPLKGFHLIRPVQADTLSLDDVLNNALLNAETSSALSTSLSVENIVTQENIGETGNEVPEVAETVEIYGVENSMGTGEATYIQETLEDESTLEEGTSHPSSSECGTSSLEITCTICNGKFKEKRYLKTHMRLKHSEDPSVASKAKQVSKEKSYNRLCTICKSYFNSRNIISHLRSMHPDVSLGFSCDLCQSTFANDWLLKRHIGNVHKKDRLYRCEICDFSAKRKEHLEEHMIVHNQVTLICDLCDFKTLRKREFKFHRCKKKDFTCDFCDHKSVSKDALRMHIKRVHK